MDMQQEIALNSSIHRFLVNTSILTWQGGHRSFEEITLQAFLHLCSSCEVTRILKFPTRGGILIAYICDSP